MSSHIVVGDNTNDDHTTVNPLYLVNLFLGERFRSEPTDVVAGVIGRDYRDAAVFLFIAVGCIERRDLLESWQADRSNDKAGAVSSITSRGPSVIGIWDVPNKLLADFYDWGLWICPNDWGLISLKITLRLIYDFPGQKSLPESEACVNGHSNERKNAHHKSLVFAGFVFFAFGVVFMCVVWWKVCFDLSPNRNVAVDVSLVLISAGFIWIGMWFLGLASGLVH